jgi:hypothetical protein
MQIDRHALGEHVARARPAHAQHQPRVGLIRDPPRTPDARSHFCGEPRGIRAFRARVPLIGADPREGDAAARRAARAVGERNAERRVDGG